MLKIVIFILFSFLSTLVMAIDTVIYAENHIFWRRICKEKDCESGLEIKLGNANDIKKAIRSMILEKGEDLFHKELQAIKVAIKKIEDFKNTYGNKSLSIESDRIINIEKYLELVFKKQSMEEKLVRLSKIEKKVDKLLMVDNFTPINVLKRKDIDKEIRKFLAGQLKDSLNRCEIHYASGNYYIRKYGMKNILVDVPQTNPKVVLKQYTKELNCATDDQIRHLGSKGRAVAQESAQ